VTQLPCTIGVIDDDVSVRSALRRLFRTAGFNVALFETAEDYLANSNRSEIDCLTIDVRLPGMGGLELLELVRKERSKPAVVITAQESDNARERALAAGAAGFFLKPFDNHALLLAVCNAIGIDNVGSTGEKSNA
jgi:FixJ family two-component response regulator